ncbi:MAG TPA: DUF4278 domain-containing protein [Leptolyngbyaceae cyanobacterium M65_K2018_010]|nr:DUF4278 domain-containing protein [Leptolyngbyaceae cyanobacterium M65_K2018_010]
MKLCYRGIGYEYNPPSLEVKESEITGCYRGRPLRFSYASHVPVPQPVAHLTYRGVGYTTSSEGQSQAPSPAPETRQPIFQAVRTVENPALKERRYLLQEAAEAHRKNIQRSLDHRLAVARAQGNEKLVQQLEEELHQLV